MSEEYEYDKLDKFANSIMDEVGKYDLEQRRKLFANIFNLINELQNRDDIVLTNKNKKKLENIMWSDYISSVSARE